MNVAKKHREIADEVLDAVKTAFPLARFVSMDTSPESENDIWIRIAVPDDDMVYPILELSSPLIIQRLVETGYKVSVIAFAEESFAT